MSSKNLLPGNYPQAPATMCHLNANKWPMNKLERAGQKIKQLRFKEITYGHEQSKDWLNEEVDPSYQEIFRLPGKCGAGFTRVSVQSKLSLGTIDVTNDSLLAVELGIREIMYKQFDIDDAYEEKRLLLTHIIFEKNGANCKWEVAEKGDGLALVLTKVNRKPVHSMILANAQGYAEGISNCLCEAKRVIQEPKEGTACPYSDETIRLIG